MFWRRIEHAVVMVLGFALGAALAMCIAPGDIGLWLATGLVLGLFFHTYFSRSFAGELFWPLAIRRHRRVHPRRE